MAKYVWIIIVSFRVVLISILLCFLGFLLIYFNTPDPSKTNSITKWQTIFCSLGSTLFAAGLISVLWDLFAKRAFAEEILARAHLSNDILKAGLIQFIDSFRSKDMDWHKLLKSTTSLDVFVCWAYTWRNQYDDLLREIISDRRGRIRIILPHPEHKPTIMNLASCFSDKNEEQIKNIIDEAIHYFEELDLDKVSGNPMNRVEVWLVGRDPKYSWYLMDNYGVFAFYAHRGKEKVPTLVFKKGGYLYEYACKEFEYLTSEQSNAIKVYPKDL